ncbi:MAG TPA: glycosyltransferase family 4 protein [Lachnospiraceae bacterium]|nr:glycosyltransferase family 4 protein [Lachnospiraceae bacterium]
MINLQDFRKEEFLRREKHLKHAKKQKLYISKIKHEHHQLHIVYVMTHVGICGGTKICFEHVNHLTRFNQRATIVSHFEKPTWFPIHKNVHYIQVPFEKELATGIPQCDVIVATYWREIYECIAREIAPVVYFEQGDHHLFSWDNVSERLKDYILKQFLVVPFIFTVSKGASEEIRKIFARDASIINNAIDHTVFYPDLVNKKDRKRDFTVTIIGSESNEFKGISVIKQALSLVKRSGYKMRLNWVSPDEPVNPIGTVFVNPKQDQIGNLLRKSDLFISASLYESFSLPVLEAMASGCTVITTKNKGVLEYAVDNENCIMATTNDPIDLANKIIWVYENEMLAGKFISAGIKTASIYTWDKIVPQLIKYYQQISSYRPVKS